MTVTLLRVLIMYALIIFSMRIMGRRQIGELQTTELVITILLSEVAAIPMQDNDIPILNSVVAVLTLVSFEIISSVISVKSRKFREIMQGNSLIIVRDGTVDLPQLKRLRFSIDDLTEALRDKNIFDISEVQYAILETNGRVSVLLKPDKRNTTAKMLNLSVPDNGMPCTVIYNGDIVRTEFTDCNMSDEKLDAVLTAKKITLNDVMLMTADRAGNFNIILKQSHNTKGR